MFHFTERDRFIAYCRYVLAGGGFRFLCTYQSHTDTAICGQYIDYTTVRDIALLTAEQRTEFETGISQNYIKSSVEIRQCPKCSVFCARTNPRHQRVVCVSCCHGGRTFDFCWYCLGEWKTSNEKDCGNANCTGLEPDQTGASLTNATPEFVVYDSPSAMSAPVRYTMCDYTIVSDEVSEGFVSEKQEYVHEECTGIRAVSEYHVPDLENGIVGGAEHHMSSTIEEGSLPCAYIENDTKVVSEDLVVANEDFNIPLQGACMQHGMRGPEVTNNAVPQNAYVDSSTESRLEDKTAHSRKVLLPPVDSAEYPASAIQARPMTGVDRGVERSEADDETAGDGELWVNPMYFVCGNQTVTCVCGHNKCFIGALFKR